MTSPLALPDAPRHLAYVPLDQVVPAVRNPKKHDMPSIVASIAEHGFADVLILDERTQRLVAGHGRTEALVHMLEHGDPMPEGLLVADNGAWMVPVLRGWSSKDDAHAEAYIIGVNHLVEAGEWDNRILVPMLDDLVTNEVDLFEGLGYTSDELDAMFRSADPERFGDQEEDPFAEPTVTPTPEDGPEESGGRRQSRPIECPACGTEFIPGEDTF